MSENWVAGDYEAGADEDTNEPIEPTGDEGDAAGDGAELGLGEPSSFEPEEDPDSV